MSDNQDYLARSRAAVWHPCTQMKRHESLPIVPVASADGAYLVDFDGRRILDAVSSWWVNLFGHNEPRIRAAIVRQLETLDHVMLAGFTHRPVVELSERLAALTGLGHAFYASDGASATEIALKMSFHYWKNQGEPGKTRFVSLEGSYHGESAGALAVTDVPLFSATYAPLIRQNFTVPSPDAREARAGESTADVARRAAVSLENLLAKHHHEIAALIVEPLVQGAAGMVMYDAEYLRQARALCDRYRVHLIADEIAVGFGRTGTLFACEQAGIRPDLLCLSKGITGGTLPLSCVLSTNDIYAAFYDDDVTRGFLHSHSYTGNAAACAAALAVLDIFESDDVLTRNRVREAEISAALAPLAAHPAVQGFRHTGQIWAFDVPGAPAGFAGLCFERMLSAGFLLRPIGQTVYLMPPYVVSAAEMAALSEALTGVLDTLPAGAPHPAAAAALP